MVAAAGEEIRQPERTLPLAILLSLVSVLGLYLLVALVAVGVVPWSELGASPAPLADAAERALGPVGRRLIALAAVVTTAATGNAVLVVCSRIAFAMGRDGLLPAALGTVHERTGAPWTAILLAGALLSGVAVGGTVELAAAVGGFLYVLHYLPPLIALVLVRRRGGAEPAFRTPYPGLVLPLAFGSALVLLVASGAIGWGVGLAWLGIGWLARLVVGRTRGRYPPAAGLS
jgi:APA family basic amino acid/polyamine antiporter